MPSGYDVILVSDAHTTDMGSLLPAESVIRHHNDLLNGFGTDRGSISVQPLEMVLKQIAALEI